MIAVLTTRRFLTGFALIRLGGIEIWMICFPSAPQLNYLSHFLKVEKIEIKFCLSCM